MATFDTATNVVRDVGMELGFGDLTTSLTSWLTATNPLCLQLIWLLRSEGRRLVRQHPLLAQKKEHSFTTTATTSFDMPDGFMSMVDGTGWNRTTDVPLVPVTPQHWQELKAFAAPTMGSYMPCTFNVSTAIVPIWTLDFPVAVTSGHTIALEYRSSNWARAAGGTFSDSPTAASDTIRIDSTLIAKALKLSWLRHKGLPSEGAQREFDETLSTVLSHNHVAGRAMAVGGARSGTWPRTRETGFGT